MRNFHNHPYVLSDVSSSFCRSHSFIFFFQAEDGIRDRNVTGVQTCALPISYGGLSVPPYAERPDSVLSRPRSVFKSSAGNLWNCEDTVTGWLLVASSATTLSPYALAISCGASTEIFWRNLIRSGASPSIPDRKS